MGADEHAAYLYQDLIMRLSGCLPLRQGRLLFFISYSWLFAHYVNYVNFGFAVCASTSTVWQYVPLLLEIGDSGVSYGQTGNRRQMHWRCHRKQRVTVHFPLFAMYFPIICHELCRFNAEMLYCCPLLHVINSPSYSAITNIHFNICFFLVQLCFLNCLQSAGTII